MFKMSDMNMTLIKGKLKEIQQDDSLTISSSSSSSSSSSFTSCSLPTSTTLPLILLSSQNSKTKTQDNSDKDSFDLSNDDDDEEDKRNRFSYQAMDSLGNKTLTKAWKEAISSTKPNIKQEHIYSIFCKLLRKRTSKIPTLKSFKSHESCTKAITKELSRSLISQDSAQKKDLLKSHLPGKFSFLLLDANKNYLDAFIVFGEYLREKDELKSEAKEKSVIEKWLRESEAVISSGRSYQFRHHNQNDTLSDIENKVIRYPTLETPRSEKVGYMLPRNQRSDEGDDFRVIIHSLSKIEQTCKDINHQLHSMQYQQNILSKEQANTKRCKRYRTNDILQTDDES